MKVTFKVDSFRTIPCPHKRDHGEKPQKTHIAICHVNNLPNDIPMSTNPREQNLNKKVPKIIRQSLLEDEDLNFHLLNRGLLISAESVAFNNKTNEVTLVFNDFEKHGDVDGGHTYKIILEEKETLEKDQYIRIEIMTGIEDFFEDLAAARNTSAQVDSKSIAELRKEFNIVKEGIKNEPFSSNIAFVENADEDIDVKEIIAILSMFNLARYNSNTHPVIAYSFKQKCIDYYLDDIKKENGPFRKMQKYMSDIFKLYDTVQSTMPDVYNDGNSSFGKIKGVQYKDGKKKFLRPFSNVNAMRYGIPKGFIYPIVGAFRAVLGEMNNQYCWLYDPFELYKEISRQMVKSSIEMSRALGNNPQSLGKNTNHWQQMYDTVWIAYTKKVMDAKGAV